MQPCAAVRCSALIVLLTVPHLACSSGTEADNAQAGLPPMMDAARSEEGRGPATDAVASEADANANGDVKGPEGDADGSSEDGASLPDAGSPPMTDAGSQ